MTFAYFISNTVGVTIAALALFFLVLTSPALMWLLSSPPFSFLGRISFSLFLLHPLVVQWMAFEFAGSKKNPEDPDSYSNGIIWAFIIFTPLLILLSWLFEFAVDSPLKELVHQIDESLAWFENPKRLKKLAAEKEKQEEEEAKEQ